MTATTEVVISEKSKPEFASDERSGMAFSRMSTMRIKAVRNSSPRLRGEGDTALRINKSRPGEGAFPQAQTRGSAPSSRPSPRKRGEGDRGAPGPRTKQALESRHYQSFDLRNLRVANDLAPE